MFASFAYEREIEGEIMNRCNLHGQQFFSFEEMVDISARINLIYTAFALRVERRKVGGPLGIAEIDNALPSKYLPIAPIARRHDAVKHIHSALYGLQNIDGRANSH